jgi:hypothetical protein
MVDLGACPRCGGDDVLHIVYGLVGAHAADEAPAWVRFAGCAVQPENRVCQTCGHEWYDDQPSPAWEPTAPEA